jgi:hypothetical protein
VPLLLSWARTPPSQIDEFDLHDLRVGLAVAFGQLKTKKAVPFLIKNINLQMGLIPRPNIWLKAPEAVEAALPAVVALIQIGPVASRELMDIWQQLDPDDRLAAIFVVSRVKGVPGAREFLHTVLSEANIQRFWAEEGLKALDGSR